MNMERNVANKGPDNMPRDWRRWSMAAAFLTAGLVDAGIFLAFADSDALLAVLALHVLLVLLLGWSLPVLQSGQDIKQLALITILFVGPPGALLAAWFIASNTAASKSEPEIVHEDGSQLDEVQQLVQQLHAKRTKPVDAPLPAPFNEVIRSGSLHDRLTVLGLVAQNYHPDYYPVIALALRCNSTSVRAQAAALATRLASHYRTRLQTALVSHFADDQQLHRCIADILECLHSGFLEPAQAAQARCAAISLCRAAQRSKSGHLSHYETLVILLLEEEQYKEAYAELCAIEQIPKQLKSRCLAYFTNGGHFELVKGLLAHEADGIASC